MHKLFIHLGTNNAPCKKRTENIIRPLSTTVKNVTTIIIIKMVNHNMHVALILMLCKASILLLPKCKKVTVCTY